MKRILLAPSLFLLALNGAARAADMPVLGNKPGAPGVFSQSRFVSEVRFGLFAHDPWSPERSSADVQAQVLFAKPIGNLGIWDLVIPRPHLGGALNTDGKTSYLHAGLTWTLDVSDKIYLEASLGGALHNGKTTGVVPANRSALGCAAHFREAVGIGYRIDARWSVTGSLEHLSNAGLCSRNRGLTNAGVMLGYRF